MNRRGRLNHAGGAALVAHEGVDDVFRFHLVSGAELPVGEDLTHGTGEILQQIDGVNSLVDQRAAAFDRPGTLARPIVVGLWSVPFHITVGLQNLSEPAVVDGLS